MQIIVNSNRSVEGSRPLITEVRATVEAALSRYADRITAVEVHLSDENAERGGSTDKRCVLEARVAGLRPTAVTHNAGTLEEAVNGAAAKLQRSLESTLGRLDEHRA